MNIITGEKFQNLCNHHISKNEHKKFEFTKIPNPSSISITLFAKCKISLESLSEYTNIIGELY